jgi:hypothetical protein
VVRPRSADDLLIAPIRRNAEQVKSGLVMFVAALAVSAATAARAQTARFEAQVLFEDDKAGWRARP